MTTGSADWSPARRLASRFVLFYLAFYVSPFDLSDESAGGVTQRLVAWTGARLGLDVSILPNGSGDTTYNYVQVLCLVVLALVAAVAFSLVERRGRWDAALFAALRVWIRYVLGYTMLTYGIAKVWKAQFPFPSPDTLMLPFGEASPMRLLWTFMGFSTAYTMFVGFGEVLGGLLLFFRRTTLAGALITAAVMVNVAMLNFSYDVPVKLYASHLLLMALFLAAPDARRLLDVFVRNRPVPAAPEPRPWTGWPRRLRLAAKTLLVGTLVVTTVRSGIEGWKKYGDGAPRRPLQGAWEVESFGRDGTETPPLLTDTKRWRRLIVTSYGFAILHSMDGTRRYFRTAFDQEKHTLLLPEGSSVVGAFTWELEGGDVLRLRGLFDGAAVDVRLRRRDESSFLLLNRGFHWVNEYPFN